MFPGSLRALRVVVAGLVVLCGIWSFAVGRAHDRASAVSTDASSFWRTTNVPHASPDEVEGGLKLTGRSTLRIEHQERGGRRVRRLEFDFVALSDDTTLVVTLRENGDRSYRLFLVPGPTTLARLDFLPAGSAAELVATAREPLGRSDPRALYSVEVVLDGASFRVRVDGVPVLEASDDRVLSGDYSIRAGAGSIRIDRLGISGTAAGGATFALEEGFESVEPGAESEFVLSDIGWPLYALLVAAAFLRSLCLGAPSSRELGRATLTHGAVLAIPCFPGFVGGHVFLLPGLALAALVGLGLGLLELRGHIRTAVERGPTGHAFLAATAIIVAVVPVSLVVNDKWERLGMDLAREEYTRRLPAGEAVSAEALVRLDASNSLVFRGPYHDIRVIADVALSKNSVLEVRLRADREKASGVVFYLSADRSFPSRFHLLSPTQHQAIGSKGRIQAAGVTAKLEILAENGSFEAYVDGELVAEAKTHEYLRGIVTLLAARGAVGVEGLEIRPTTTGGEVGSPALSIASFAGPALLFLFGLAAGVSLLLRISFLNALAAFAVALVPLAIATGALDDYGGLKVTAVAWTSMAMLSLSFSILVVHARRLTPLRYLVLMVLLLWSVPTTVIASTGLSGVGDGAMVAGIRGLGDATLRDHLLYMQHPAARHLNDYLAFHRFRTRSFAVPKPAGTKRVVCIGTSSTWGYGLTPRSGQDYPTILETLLSDGSLDHPVEVINAGIPGSNGASLYRFLRDALEPFGADVLTVSLYFNDSFAHTQWDQESYYEKVVSASPLARLPIDYLTRRRLRQGTQLLVALDQAFRKGGASTLELWRRHGLPGGDQMPTARYGAMLRRFCEYARARGIELILIKEPLADDKPFLWKDEFYGVIDEVAEEYGLRVIDPTPALLRAGGGRLFQDQIHPTAEGNVIIAHELLPAVRQALE